MSYHRPSHARRAVTTRLIRIVLGRSNGGRVLPGIIQLGLICVWHPAIMLVVESIPFDFLQEWSSYAWYSSGLTSSYVSDICTVDLTTVGGSGVYVMAMAATVRYVLLEALFGWIGYRVLVRRPKPKWYRFVRCWWRTCLIGTIVVPAAMTLAALLPISPGSELLMLGPVALFCVGPGWLARQEISRRARRVGEVCSACGYNLTGNVSGRCPECGEVIQQNCGTIE